MTFAYFLTVTLIVSMLLSLIMVGAWAVERRTGNAGWVDTIWTFGLMAVGIAAALAPAINVLSSETRQYIIAILVLAWGMRLGLHIGLRTRKIEDDPRYAHLKKEWGAQASNGMFLFLQQQAFGTVPLVMAIFLAAQTPAPELRFQDFLGFAILLIGIVGEAIADAQLTKFRSNSVNKGGVCNVGLWNWSRHPNYFFQWLGWLAYPIIAIDFGGHDMWGTLALIGPAMMYFVLVYATGVPHLERHMQRTRGAVFEAYKARTSQFFLWPPK